MFLALNKLKKNIEKAYKHRVVIGCINNGIVITGSTWILWISNDIISNDVKALVVKCIGDIPNEGEIFEAGKDIPTQLVLKDSVGDVLARYREKADTEVTVTPILISSFSFQRMLQIKTTGELMFINEEYYESIDKNCIEFDKEKEPMGPFTIESGEEPNVNALYWTNEQCEYIILPIKPNEESEFYRTNRRIDFSEKI